MTALKTITMYLRAATAEAEAAGESVEGMAKSTSDLRDQIKHLTSGKVDIMVDDSTFKSTYQILKEISAVWQDISHVDQGALIELMGGKRNANIITSLLTNFTTAEDALVAANNAAGSALAENEKYLDSILGKVAVLQAEFQTFSADFISSDLAKLVVDIGTGVIRLLDGLQQIKLLIPAIITVGTLTKINQVKTAFGTSKAAVDQLANSIIGMNGVSNSAEAAIRGMTQVQQAQVVAAIQEAVAHGECGEEILEQTLSVLGLTSAEGAATVATEALTAAQRKLTMVGVVGALSAILSVLVPLIAEWIDFEYLLKSTDKRIDELSKSLNELSEQASEISATYRSTYDSASDVIPRFAELAKGVDQFGKNASLTKDEYEEFLELNNQLAEMFPELNMGMDAQGNAMLAVSYAADTLSESLWALVDAERAAANKKLVEMMPDTLDQLTKLEKELETSQRKTEVSIGNYTSAINYLRYMARTGEYTRNERILKRYTTQFEDLGVSIKYPDGFGGNNKQRQTTAEYTFDIDEVERRYKNILSGLYQSLEADSAELALQYKKLNPIIAAWSQSNLYYTALSSEMQDAATALIQNFDVASVLQHTTLKGEELSAHIRDLISKTIIEPIYNATPEVQAAIATYFDVDKLFNSGQITLGQYQERFIELNKILLNNGFGSQFIRNFTSGLASQLDIAENQIKPFFNSVTHDVGNIINQLNNKEIELLLKINPAKGSLYTLDDVRELIEWYENRYYDPTEDMDFSDVASKMKAAHDAISGLTSALEKTKEGTALTKSELAQLALEYPELINYAELFTETSVDGQRKILEAVVATAEAERKAILQTQKTELEASRERLLAKQKLLEAEVANAKIASHVALLNAKNAKFDMAIAGVDMSDSNIGTREDELQTVLEQLEQIANQIQNIDDIWDFGYDEIFGTDSDSGTKSVEKYVAELDEYYEISKQINQLEETRSDIEAALARTDDMQQRIGFGMTLVELYKKQIAAEIQLKNQREDAISANVEKLRALGFEVEYSADAQTFLIKNMERLNELTVDSQGKYDTLQEAINAHRKETEDLIEETDKLNDSNRESANTIRDYAHDIEDSTETIIESIQACVDTVRDSLNDATDAYDTLKSAAQSFAENGYLTVDAFESILSLGTEYLAYLRNESGEIEINEEKLRSLIAAKAENLAYTQALALVETVAQYRNDIAMLEQLAYATRDAAAANWELVYSQMKSLGLTPELEAAFLQQIDTLRSMAASVRETGVQMYGLGSSASGSNLKDYYNEASDALDYILDKTMELIEYETNQKIEALEKQVDKYQEIIDLKKEALDKTKEEDDYEESVAEKVAEIAELQAKIDRLSLDTSREASVEKSALLDELHDKQKDLSDLQADHSIESQKTALDDMATAYEKEKQDEIEILENSISSQEKLYQEALSRIQNNWHNLYHDLMVWNVQAGSSINSEITENWNKAAAAVRQYGSYVSAVAGIDAKISAIDSGIGTTVATYGTGSVYGSGQVSVTPTVITSSSSSIPQFTGINAYTDLLKWLGERHHTGGVAGNDPTAKQKEVLALLENGEMILDDAKQQGIYRVIEFQSEVSKKLCEAVRGHSMTPATPGIAAGLHGLSGNITNNSSVEFKPNIEVHISHSGNMTDKDARAYGQTIADMTLDKLQQAFQRKGVTDTRSARLKP